MSLLPLRLDTADPPILASISYLDEQPDTDFSRYKNLILVRVPCKDHLETPNLISINLHNLEKLTTAFDRSNIIKGNTHVELASSIEQSFDRQGSTKLSNKIRPLAHSYPLY